MVGGGGGGKEEDGRTEVKMAECVAARCVQERRFFKRELQKWGKNVLYLVGLERVAEEVVGHKKWRKLTRPLGDDDCQVPEAVDWSPEEKCFFCTNRKNSSSSANRSKTANNSNGTIDDDYVDDQDSREGSPCSVASDQPLDLSMGSKVARSHSPVSHNGDVNGSTFLKVPRLPDKSRKLKRRSDTATTNTATASVASSGGIAAASSSKRSYTDDELQAALRDIRSGKLGTRRAAVIYGIPRSTLRNKVYKMSMDKVALDVSSSKSKDATTAEGVRPLTMEDLVAGTDDGISASESLKRLLRNRMAERLETKKAATSVGQALSSLESNSALTPFLSHVLSNIQHLALSHQGVSDGGRETIINELKLPLLPDLIRKLSEERFEEECNRVHHRDGGLHGTESVILKIPSYKPVKTRSNNNNNSGGGCEATASSQSASVIRGESNVGDGAKAGGAVTLREIVAKSVSQQTGSNSRKIPVNSTSVTNGSEASLSLKSFTKERISSSSSSTSSKRKPTTMSSDNRCSSTSISSKMPPRVNDDDDDEETNKSEKRMRPKRGRYRNYDRDNLVEAVRAVQRGEMSVHRAGSYYGVPHSTLEYKVKERHLLRPKKRRSGQSDKHRHKKSNGPSVASSKSSFVASSGSNSCSNSSNDGSSHDSIPTSTEKGLESNSVNESDSRIGGVAASQPTVVAAAANTTPSTSSLWPFSLDLGRLNSSNFFASQMMRKLQEDAMMQAKHDGENGIDDRDALLLGVLIRNGLQIKPAETASTK